MTDSKVRPVIVFKDDKHLIDLIGVFNGHSMSSIDMTTIPKCTVKSRQNKDVKYGDVFEGQLMCTSHRFVAIGYDYHKSLTNKIKKMVENGDPVDSDIIVKYFPSFEMEENPPEIFENHSESFKESIASAESVTNELPWGNWFEGSKIIIEHTPKSTGEHGYYLRITYLNINGKHNEKIYHYENGDIIDERAAEQLDNFLPVPRKSTILVNSVKVAGIVRLNFDGKTYVRKGYLTSEDRTKLNVWLDAVAENDDAEIENIVA